MSTDSNAECITAMRFYVLSAEEIIRYSVCRITRDAGGRLCFDANAANTLTDRRMGPAVKGEKCVTCGGNEEECVGHYGSIELTVPIIVDHMFPQIRRVMQMICATPECDATFAMHFNKKKRNWSAKRPTRCPKCLKRLPKIESAKDKSGFILQTVVDDKRPDERKSAAKRATKSAAIQSEADGDDSDDSEDFTDSDSDASEEEEPAMVDPRASGLGGKRTKNAAGAAVDKRVEKRYFSAHSVFKLICSKSDTVWKELGFDVRYTHPRNFVTRALVVIPPSERPFSQIDGSWHSDGLTALYAKVVKCNEYLKQLIERGKEAHVVRTNEEKLRNAVRMLVDSTKGTSLGSTAARNYISLAGGSKGSTAASNLMLQGFAQRMCLDKYARIRGSMMGGRVENTARAVVSADPRLALEEMGLPQFIADRLDVQIRVYAATMNECRSRILSHRAKTVIKRDGTRIKIMPDDNCAALANTLEVGDIVERGVENGDYVLLNRQPSLHKASIMCFRAVIKQGYTISFNMGNCKPYNADFDGDEMNVHVPRTVEAVAEASELMAVRTNIVSPQNNKPQMGLIYDALLGARLMSLQQTFLDEFRFSQTVMSMRPHDPEDSANDARSYALAEGIVVSSKGESMLGFEQSVFERLPPPNVFVVKGRYLEPDPDDPSRTRERAVVEYRWTGKAVLSLAFPRMMDYGTIQTAKDDATRMQNETKPQESPFGDESTVVVRGGQLICGTLSSKTIGNEENSIIHEIHNRYGQRRCAEFITNIQFMIYTWNGFCGRTFGLEDCLIHDKQHLAQIKAVKSELVNNWPRNASDADVEAFTDSTSKRLFQLPEPKGFAEVTLSRLRENDNNLTQMVMAGSKGSVNNRRQIAVGLGQQTVAGRRIVRTFNASQRSLPHFRKGDNSPIACGHAKSNYTIGLTPVEWLFHSMSGMEGVGDSVTKTPRSGYMHRQLEKSMENNHIMADGTVRKNGEWGLQMQYGEDGFDGAAFQSSYVHKSELVGPRGETRTDSPENEWYPAFDAAVVKARDNLKRFAAKSFHPITECYKITMPLTSAKLEGESAAAIQIISYEKDEAHAMLPLTWTKKDVRWVMRELARMVMAFWELEPRGSEARARYAKEVGTTRDPDSIRAAAMRISECADLSWIETGNALITSFLLSTYSPARVVKRGWSKRRFAFFIEAAISTYGRAKVHYSECVGSIAAQSISEPATQMSLSSFHMIGGAGLVSLIQGIPRLMELLYYRHDKTPVVSLQYFPGQEKRYAAAKHALEAVFMHNILKCEPAFELARPIESQPNYVRRYRAVFGMHRHFGEKEVRAKSAVHAAQTTPPTMQDRSKATEHTIEPVEKRFLVQNHNEPTLFATDGVREQLLRTNERAAEYSRYKTAEKPHDWDVELTFDPDGLIKHAASLNEIAQLIQKELTLEESVAHSFFDLRATQHYETPTIRVFLKQRTYSSMTKFCATTRRMLLRGVVGVAELKPPIGGRLGSFSSTVVCANSKNTDPFKTDVIRGIAMAIEDDIFDYTKTTSNSVHTAFSMYGIEVARRTLIDELYSVIASTKQINKRHVLMLVDTMVFSGTVQGITRNGLHVDNTSPLGKASYEESIAAFVSGAARSTLDTLDDTSARIAVGAEFRGGTGLGVQTYKDIEAENKFAKPIEERNPKKRAPNVPQFSGFAKPEAIPSNPVGGLQSTLFSSIPMFTGFANSESSSKSTSKKYAAFDGDDDDEKNQNSDSDAENSLDDNEPAYYGSDADDTSASDDNRSEDEVAEPEYVPENASESTEVVAKPSRATKRKNTEPSENARESGRYSPSAEFYDIGEAPAPQYDPTAETYGSSSVQTSYIPAVPTFKKSETKTNQNKSTQHAVKNNADDGANAIIAAQMEAKRNADLARMKKKMQSLFI